jgi:RND family efflux transporter MFP subunit
LNTTEIEAQVFQANEALAKAIRDESRVGNLYRDSVATLENYQNAKTAWEVARKNVEIALFNKNQSKIYSPISGVIVKKIMNEGEVVGPGMAVCAIMGLNQKDWKVTAALTEKEWAAVKKGDKATIILDAYPNQKLNAIVTDKSLIGGSPSGTLDVTLRFVNAPPNMAGGLLGKVSINQSVNTNQKVIPLSAITKIKANTATIFTIENGKAKKLHIRTGQVVGKFIEVLDGMDGVQTVVTTGAMYLEDGDLITIQ